MLVALLIAILLNLFVLRLGIVHGNSMSPTLLDKDIIIVFRFDYHPKTGDIVVTSRDNETGLSLTKRIIATEGDLIEAKNNLIYINGNPTEIKISENRIFIGSTVERIVVPKKSLFLIGDNFDDSKDSRDFGFFSEDELIGKSVLRIFPFRSN